MTRDTDHRRRLIRMIEREIEHPGTPQELHTGLRNLMPEAEALLRLLQLKDEHHRRAFYVKSESVWYRRFGWRIMRPLFLIAVLAAIGFSAQRAIEPTLAFACFVLGAVAVYLSIQYFAHRWSRQDLEKLTQYEAEYRRELTALRDELTGRG